MFCTHCGNELKDGSRFCNACGAPVEASAEEPLAEAQAKPLPDEPPAPAQTSFAGQMESDRQRSRKKLSPLMILVIVLALLAATALAAVLVTQQANQDEQVEAPQAEAPQAEAPQADEAQIELSPEEQAIADLDGWWYSSYHDAEGFRPAFGNIHDSVIDWYRYSSDTRDVFFYSTVGITEAERFSENNATGWRFFTDTSDNKSWAYYEVDGDADELPIYKTAFGYGVIDSDSYNIFSPERYGMSRITDPSVLDDGLADRGLLKKAQDLAAARESEKPSADGETFDQAAAEAEARAAAEATGKQIFTGTIELEDAITRMQETGSPGAIGTDYSNPTFAFMVLDSPATVTAKNPDGGTNQLEPYRAHGEVESILLGSTDSYDPGISEWQPYEGEKVTIACSRDEMSFFSDAMGALFGARARSAEIIAPLTASNMKAESTASTSGGDYFLADSATRSYSRSELEKLSNHDLFIARNEIYARHGRKFKSSELQQYFGSKSWYHPTIEAADFVDGMLSDIELANAHLMLDIETARGSEYIQ